MFEFNKPETFMIFYNKRWKESIKLLIILIDSKDNTKDEIVGRKTV